MIDDIKFKNKQEINQIKSYYMKMANNNHNHNSNDSNNTPNNNN